MEKTIIIDSIITCPNCSFQKEEQMPTDSCQYFFKCINCEIILKPNAGDCCVFCSYGSIPCPPIQTGKSCC
nr:GDCCVxC domain-containing (seleno)protein [Pelobium sp.]